MKILLVNKFHYLKGGSERYYFDLAKLLEEHGHEVAFFSMKNEKNIKTKNKEYLVDEIDLNTGSKLKALDIIYSRANKKLMEKALDEFKPDIVHINNFQRQLSSSILQPIKKRKIPVVMTAHDMQAICPNIVMLDNKGQICEKCLGGKYLNCTNKKCIKDSTLKSILGTLEAYYYRIKGIYKKKIDCIISPSEFNRQKLIEDGLSAEKIVTMHNFIENTSEKIKTSDEGYALYFGRLSEEKGILEAIKALEKIEDKELYIAGEGPEKSKIEDYIKQNNLEKRVILLGFLNKEQIIEKISKCAFTLVPSTWYENCPYSVLETLEIGKPIIATNIGGVPELIIDNKTGLLYNKEHSHELLEKMQELFANEELRKTLGKNAKEFATKEFSKENYYNKLYSIYEKSLKMNQ